MNKLVNLGVIGAGSVFRLMHLPAILKLKDKFRIISVYDRDEEAIRKIKKSFKNKINFEFSSNPSGIITNPQIDAITVLTPTSTHIKYSLKALNGGRHVFLEKPAAVNLKDILKVKSAEKRNNKFVQIGMVLRYSSFYRELKKIICSGKYGKVLWMNWIETRPFDPAMWRYNNTSKNGDAIIHDKAIHQINLFNAFAESKPADVMAAGGQYLLSKNKFSKVRAFSKEVSLKGESCDHLMCLIQYKNGVKASLTVSYVSPQARESRWVIQLEKAKIIAHFETFVSKNSDSKHNWKGNPSCIYLFKDDKKLKIPWKYPASYPPSDKNLVFYDEYKGEPLHPGSTEQWLAFYETVTKNKKPFCNTDLSLDDTIIAEAIAKSIKQNRIIKFK